MGTEGGDSTQEKARGQDPLCLHVHILLVDTSEIPQLQPEYPSLLSTHVLCLALVSAMCPQIVTCMAILSLQVVWDANDWIPTLKPLGQTLSVSSLTDISLFLAPVKIAICPWQSHSSFGQVLAFPGSFAARSGYVIQFWL